MRLIGFAATMLLTAGTAHAQDQADAAAQGSGIEFEIASGADWSSGDYGATDKTTVWSVPLDLKVTSGRFRAQASGGWVRVKGPGQIVGGVIVAAPAGVTTSRSGFADINLSASYAVTQEEADGSGPPTIELGGGVKLPTAKSTIGTGKADWSASASVYKTVAPGVMLFGSAGYSWVGSPSAYVLEDGITASGGLNYRPAENQNYGISAAYREPIAAGVDGQAVVSPYMTYRFSNRFGLTLYGVAGLNDASPEVGAGLRISIFP